MGIKLVFPNFRQSTEQAKRFNANWALTNDYQSTNRFE